MVYYKLYSSATQIITCGDQATLVKNAILKLILTACIILLISIIITFKVSFATSNSKILGFLKVFH